MSLDSFDESSKRVRKIVIWICCITISIIVACYFGYSKHLESKLKAPEDFSVEVNTKDINEVGKKWLEKYTEQYKEKFLPRSSKLVEYSIENIEVKDTNIVQIDFSVVTKKMDSKAVSRWNGVLDKNKIKCQWVLWFKQESTKEGNYIYTVTKLQRPAGYDLEKYNTSGQKEKDEYKQKYEAEIPYEKKQYTYKIENKICYVSYNGGSSWIKVPVSLDSLVAVGDGRAYYNKLQDNSYVISPEKTAFIYGGTKEVPLQIIYSEDKGNTWNTVELNRALEGTRLRFCSFPSLKVGYVITAGDRAMSQESQIIFKTTDGGATWKQVGAGPRTSLLQSAGFVDENIGFMSYPKIEGAATNFYRTVDGGKTFEPIILPAVREQQNGATFEPFIQPETPYIENGELFLLVGQGPQGDFKGGRLMAKFKSNDKGKTWTFVELIEPPSKEIGQGDVSFGTLI